MNNNPTEVKLKSDIPVTLIQSMGSDKMVCGAAWASTSADKALERLVKEAEEDMNRLPGLINYLMKSRHGSVFEHNVFTVAVTAPIFVWREWMRHRIASYNEQSARYMRLEPVFYVPGYERPMIKEEKFKASRPGFVTFDELVGENMMTMGQAQETYASILSQFRESYEYTYDRYMSMLDMDIDPGLARDVLPVGIYSTAWVTMNVRAAMNFLSLRVNEPTAMFPSRPLFEIDMAARKVEAIVAELYPITHKSFVDNGRVCP